MQPIRTGKVVTRSRLKPDRQFERDHAFRHRHADIGIQIFGVAQPVHLAGVVQKLLTACHLDIDACTGEVKELPDQAAAAFRESVLDARRTYPFVLVSPTSNGRYLVDVDR